MVEPLRAVPPPGPLKNSTDIELYVTSLVDWLKTSLMQTFNDRLIPEIAALPTADTGETNTGSNLGSGSNVFKQKTVADFEFRSINASAGITDAQSATEVTLVLDIDTLGQLSVAPADGDKIAIYDVDASTNKYIEVADLLSVGVADAQTADSGGVRGDGQMAAGIRVARYTTVGSGHSMTLPNPSGAGDTCVVMNDDSTNALKVWADIGDSLEGGTDISLAAGDRATFTALTTTAWYQH